MTTVSVAMCTCNRERFVVETLEALAAQTRLPDEVVIGDDRSTDRTCKLIEDFARRAPFPVRLHHNEARYNLAGNYSRTIGRTTGDVVALCDDDDVWLPDKLEAQATALEATDGPLLVFGDAILADERLAPKGGTFWDLERFLEGARQQARDQGLFPVQLRTNVALCSTVAFTAELKALALPIPDVWKPDWWLSSLAAALERVDWIPRPVMHYRLHASNRRGVKGRGLIQQWRQGQSDNLADYQVQLDQAEGLRDRLRQSGRLAPGHPFQGLLGARIDHLRCRISMRRRSRPARGAMIVRELVRGQYHRYSLGLRSALKDAVF